MTARRVIHCFRFQDGRETIPGTFPSPLSSKGAGDGAPLRGAAAAALSLLPGSMTAPFVYGPNGAKRELPAAGLHSVTG